MSQSNLTPDDGGAAFPGFQYTEGRGPMRFVPGPNGEGGLEAHAPGMLLRDYIAVKAMAGSLAGVPGPHLMPHTLAREAYTMADAMLKARSA